MKRLFFFIFTTCLCGFFVLSIVSYRQLQKKVYPHTYVARLDMSGKEKIQTEQVLKNAYSKMFKLKIKDRIYEMAYEQIGILLDTNAGINALFEYNRRPFPSDITAYVQSLRRQRLLLPPLLFTDRFEKFIAAARFDFTKEQDRVDVDNGNKRLNFTDNSLVYTIDKEHLRSLVVFGFGQTNPVFEPRLIQVSSDEKKQAVEVKNSQIQEYFKQPIQIVVPSAKGIEYVHLAGDELRKIFDVTYDAQKQKVEFVHNDTLLAYMLESKIDPLLTRNKKLDIKGLRESVISAFNSRITQVDASSQLIEVQQSEMTNTHGEIASRYIEIDLSLQKLFLFEGGNMIRSYAISSGLHHVTPTGSFKIMNKALDAYSDIYNVWMPYWMAFYYGEDVDAYFGIHELPYWYADGERKQRPREFLGAPHTGGCVSLDIGAAKEAYDFSYVGMDVVIFN